MDRIRYKNSYTDFLDDRDVDNSAYHHHHHHNNNNNQNHHHYHHHHHPISNNNNNNNYLTEYSNVLSSDEDNNSIEMMPTRYSYQKSSYKAEFRNNIMAKTENAIPSEYHDKFIKSNINNIVDRNHQTQQQLIYFSSDSSDDDESIKNFQISQQQDYTNSNSRNLKTETNDLLNQNLNHHTFNVKKNCINNNAGMKKPTKKSSTKKGRLSRINEKKMSNCSNDNNFNNDRKSAPQTRTITNPISWRPSTSTCSTKHSSSMTSDLSGKNISVNKNGNNATLNNVASNVTIKTDEDLGSDIEECGIEENYGDDDERDYLCSSSSDTDDDYRKSYTKELEKTKSLSITLAKTTYRPIVQVSDVSIFSPSLFPNVPPYLTFATHTDKGPLVLPEIHKILKFKQSKVMPRIVRLVLANTGCRVLKNTNEWIGTWGRHMKSICFKSIRPYQKFNHLPGSFSIGRKDTCWRKLRKQMMIYGKRDFGFMPKTYIFPNDMDSLRQAWPKYCGNNTKWILKPPASARGTGIKVINMWCQIPKRRPLIVQKYIERPLLINGSKFDMRLYVLVTSINPLRVYLYDDGLARFASVKYSNKTETLYERCMHLTNYSLNKKSSFYTKNDDVNACSGHKWTVKSLWKYLESRKINTHVLWNSITKLILRTIMAGESSMNNMIKLNVSSRYSCYELFGFDILLDSDLVPWLLEVNISPSLHSDLVLDTHVKGPLVRAVLNTALYHLPPKLSAEKEEEICKSHNIKTRLCYDKRIYITYLSQAEKIKHNKFTKSNIDHRDQYLNDILEFLTPDDVRCLITAEDELSKCAPLERIFPTSSTHSYLKYTSYPRYYNRLLDAWEHRYGQNRQKGIEILRKYCEDNYHLQVPSPPIQRQINIRNRTMKKWSTRRTKLTKQLIAKHQQKLLILSRRQCQQQQQQQKQQEEQQPQQEQKSQFQQAFTDTKEHATDTNHVKDELDNKHIE